MSANVSAAKPREVASLDDGRKTRATTSAAARSRQREPLAASSRSSPQRRNAPSTAATWPWGRVRTIENPSLRPLDCGSAPEQRAQTFDQVVRPVGEVGNGAFADLAVLTIGLSEQDGRRGVSVGDGLDVHDH